MRISTALNRAVWLNGIRNIPRRIRVRVTRKRNEDEDAAEKFFSVVDHIPCEDFSNLKTENADVDA